jgi:hypothetical protein
MCLWMNFTDRKEPRKTLSADVDGPSKSFFSKTVAIILPRHPKKLPPRRNVPLRAMLSMGWGVADSPPRPTQHKRNAVFFVSRCVGMDADKMLPPRRSP